MMSPFVRFGDAHRCRCCGAFTLIELLVVIAIISLLVSILLPSLNRAKELAKRVICMTQLKQIGSAYALYGADWGNSFPPCYIDFANKWYVSLANPYMGFSETDSDLAVVLHDTETVFTCPTQIRLHTESINKRTYGMNHSVRVEKDYCTLNRVSDAKSPTDTCLAGDGHYNHSGPYWVASIGPPWDVEPLSVPFPEPVHDNGDNFLYMDMHVEWLSQDDIPDQTTTPTPEGDIFWRGQ